MATCTPNPTRRVVALWAMLATSSLIDLALTLTAADGIPQFAELNPLAANLLTHGAWMLVMAKITSLLLTLGLCIVLARAGRVRWAERTLIGWSGFYACLNAASLFMLLGGT